MSDKTVREILKLTDDLEVIAIRNGDKAKAEAGLMHDAVAELRAYAECIYSAAIE